MSATPYQQREISRIPVGMRPGKRQLNSASLDVRICEAVPEEKRSQTREITHVYVPPEDRRRRLATALLNFVCQEADANRIVLILRAGPFQHDEDEVEGPDEDQLVAWYKRFGFQVLEQTPEGTVMARPVQLPANIIVSAAIRRAMRGPHRG